MAQGIEWTPEQRETIIQSLRPHLELGFSRNKACSLIGLPPQTLSNWIKQDEALGMRIESWENTLTALAMANVASALQKEAEADDARKETSKWWLERRMKQDFSLRQENTGADGKDLPTPILAIPNVPTHDSNQEGSGAQ